MSESTQDLVQQGLTAARVGDREDAHRLLKRATERMPYNVEAWLALAGVVDSLAEKEKCFTKVLTLDPGNSEAEAGLALVKQKLAGQKTEATVEETTVQKPERDAGIGVCYRHPDTETGLRCNRCGKFICPKCAIRTPVGFRCPDCIREQEDKYFSGSKLDYVIAAVIAFPLSLVVAGLFTTILGGFGFFTLIIGFFVAPAATGAIAEAVRWGVKKRRSRYLRHVVIGSLVLATAPFILFALFFGSGIFGLIGPGLLLFLGIATISARLR